MKRGHVKLRLEADVVRFTPNGRIAVVDAIGALSEDGCPARVWENLKRENPHLARICEDYAFPGSAAEPVTDLVGWMIIQELLLDHIVGSAG